MKTFPELFTDALYFTLLYRLYKTIRFRVNVSSVFICSLFTLIYLFFIFNLILISFFLNVFLLNVLIIN